MEAMESVLLGPLLYLLIAWGVATCIFIVLIIWRSLLSSHEDDQIFIDPGQERLALEQKVLVGKINSLSRPLMTSGIASGVLLLVMMGMVVYHGLKSNF
jgi:hypothetical protein